MDGSVTARTALLQALRAGPDFGLGLIRRLRVLTQGRVRLPQGSVYPTLRELQDQRLVRSWIVVPGRRRGGRGRRYYELTVQGRQVAEAERRALQGLTEDRPSILAQVTASDMRRMAERIRQASELSAFVLEARAALRRTTRLA
jgi:PadR family transcriptional regulator, regulatory protein PadR